MLTDPGIYEAVLSRQDRILFDIAPAPIWLEDWSQVAAFCDEIRATGVADLRQQLESDEILLRNVVSRIRVVDVNDQAVAFVGAADREGLLGHLPGELLNRSTLDSLVDQILVIWEGKSHLQVAVSGIDFGGDGIDAQLDWAATVRDGVPDYSQVIVLVRDVSHHVATEREMHRHVEQLETLLDMGRGIASTFDVDIILELLVETAVDLIGAEESLILLFDTDKEELSKIVSHAYPQEEIADHSYQEVMDGLSGLVATSRQATRSDDIATDSRNKGLAAARAARFPGTSVAVAPIIVDDLVLGTLTTLNNAGSANFTDMDLSLVRMLAMQAAVAIRNAALYEELRDNRDRVHAAHEKLKETQTQLLAAQKLEAIGSLAAGIAHEINTPIQFVTDNTTFVKEAIDVLCKLSAAHNEFIAQCAGESTVSEEAARLEQMWADLDCDFYFEEIPQAIEETLEGAQRVAEIVRAMKEFAHPGSESKAPVDVNRVVETTMKVSRNEWKYVAEMELDLDEKLPLIEGLAGPLGQSLLILFVNAAQAMAELRDIDEEGKGLISVATNHTDDFVEIRVADNGPGIPESIRSQIFDPFFTTKEVGTGSGQGLSIAWSVVVDKHQGQICVEDGDPGAVFRIQLPIKDQGRSSNDQ